VRGEASSDLASLTVSAPQGRGLTISVALGNVLVPLNSTMIVVALPQVARDLGVDVAATSWLVTAYLIAMASLQPIAGRLGDRFGRRRVMLGALVYFALASAGAAASPGLVPLAFFRLMQAVAAATIVPNGFGLLREALPSGGRGTEFGIVSAAASLGASVGPLVGGLLATIDWRLVFLVNVPAAALAFATAWRVVPSRAAHPRTRFDLAGAAWLGAVLLAIAYALTSLGRGFEALPIALGIAAVPAAYALLRFEARRTDPMLPPGLFRIRPFAAACGTVALQNVTLYGTTLAVPIALAGASVRSGIALAAFSASSVVFAPIGGRISDRFGPRWPTFAGALVLGTGVAPLAIAGTGLPIEAIVGTLAFAGIGLGLTFPSMRLAAVEAVPERHAALATGVFQTSRYFGGMSGSIAVAIAFGAAAVGTVDARPLFATLAAAAFVATIPSLLLQGEAAPHEDVLAEDVAG